jgi:hypothetical protein
MNTTLISSQSTPNVRTLPPNSVYSNPMTNSCQVKLYYDQQSVGQSILVSGTRLRPATNFFLLSLIIFRHRFSDVGHSLTRSWVCSFQGFFFLCWTTLAQAFSVLNPTELMSVFFLFYFLRLPPTWRAMFLYLFPPGIG